ncbi:hypothetical protein D3C80_1946380 [compost metagenome]
MELEKRNGDPISYREMRDASISAIRKAGAGECSRKCLEAQLDDYYKKCDQGDKENIKANSGTKTPETSSPTETDGNLLF